MANCTVTPPTLLLALTQHAVTLPGATHEERPAAFALALTMPPSRVSCAFPIISRKPSEVFSDQKSDNAIMVADRGSGYPLLNKLVTFDGRTFSFELPAVPDAEKVIIVDFYETHKDSQFPWYNYQDKTWYEVCFAGEPGCRLEVDGCGDLWRISITFRQTSP